MNVKYYPAQLSALIIDADLAMGAHGITLGAAQTVDGIDVSLQKTNMDNLIRQLHPNVSVLAAIDEATLEYIVKSGTNYVLGNSNNDLLYSLTFDSLTDGGLNGQDNWSGGVYMYVQSIVYQGASGKAIRGFANFTNSIDRPMSPILIGKTICYLRQAATDKNPSFELVYTGSKIFGVMLHNGGHIQYHDSTGNYINLPTDISWSIDTWYKIEIEFDCTTNKYVSIKIDDVEKGSDLDAVSSSEINAIRLYYSSSSGVEHNLYYDTIIVYGKAVVGNVFTNAFAANAAVLSFFSHLKGKFSNGASSHANPVQAEIYGNGDAYSAALNGTTKFKIDPADPRIELYRIDDSEVAKSNDQTDWTMDDNVTNGAFPTKTTSTHDTILGEEIGCASVIMVEKSVNGAFTDTELIVEDDDYTVDYSTRTATKIILTSAEAADIVISQSKLRITWIADVEDIEGTANTALKMKIYLSRTNTGEASPEIQKVDLGTDKYAEMKYTCG